GGVTHADGAILTPAAPPQHATAHSTGCARWDELNAPDGRQCRGELCRPETQGQWASIAQAGGRQLCAIGLSRGETGADTCG
ncbi:MAG: hypothetical protein AAF215_35320, partial [Cyanobacteria bacterium P01_A01_bin.123]